MTAKIIDGKAIARQVRAQWKKRVEALKERGITPGIAVIIVGDNPASKIYGGWFSRGTIGKSRSRQRFTRIVERQPRDGRIARLHAGACSSARITLRTWNEPEDDPATEGSERHALVMNAASGSALQSPADAGDADPSSSNPDEPPPRFVEAPGGEAVMPVDGLRPTIEEPREPQVPRGVTSCANRSRTECGPLRCAAYRLPQIRIPSIRPRHRRSAALPRASVRPRTGVRFRIRARLRNRAAPRDSGGRRNRIPRIRNRADRRTRAGIREVTFARARPCTAMTANRPERSSSRTSRPAARSATRCKSSRRQSESSHVFSAVRQTVASFNTVPSSRRRSVYRMRPIGKRATWRVCIASSGAAPSRQHDLQARHERKIEESRRPAEQRDARFRIGESDRHALPGNALVIAMER